MKTAVQGNVSQDFRKLIRSPLLLVALLVAVRLPHLQATAVVVVVAVAAVEVAAAAVEEEATVAAVATGVVEATGVAEDMEAVGGTEEGVMGVPVAGEAVVTRAPTHGKMFLRLALFLRVR